MSCFIPKQSKKNCKFRAVWIASLIWFSLNTEINWFDLLLENQISAFINLKSSHTLLNPVRNKACLFIKWCNDIKNKTNKQKKQNKKTLQKRKNSSVNHNDLTQVSSLVSPCSLAPLNSALLGITWKQLWVWLVMEVIIKGDGKGLVQSCAANLFVIVVFSSPPLPHWLQGSTEGATLTALMCECVWEKKRKSVYAYNWHGNKTSVSHV